MADSFSSADSKDLISAEKASSNSFLVVQIEGLYFVLRASIRPSLVSDGTMRPSAISSDTDKDSSRKTMCRVAMTDAVVAKLMSMMPVTSDTGNDCRGLRAPLGCRLLYCGSMECVVDQSPGGTNVVTEKVQGED